MSVTEIVLDPTAILQMTPYFEKNSSKALGGATFGFLYAKQVELKYNITLTAPLGTEKESLKELLSRAENFENIRKTKSKTTDSFFLEHDFVGVYLMRKKNEKEESKVLELSDVFAKKGAPYALIVVVDDAVEGLKTTFLKDRQPHPYTNEMHTNEKICLDSFNNQNSKSLIGTTIRKQTTMIQHFNEKIKCLLEKIKTNNMSEGELVHLAEILDNYDRIKFRNEDNKMKTIEAMNYSILVGLNVSRLMKE